MDRLRKARGPVRASFTRTFNQLVLDVSVESPDKEAVEFQSRKLERLFAELTLLDTQVADLMLDDGASEQIYNEERVTVEEYMDKMDIASVKIVKVLALSMAVRPQSPTNESLTSSSAQRKKFRLPKLELQKFSGEIKDWLGFWSLFKKIHEDEDIDDGDKFQYLIQSTVSGSRARELVNSFPPTSENYPKVIDCLKSRFGRDDLLVEVYVRELLKLVIQNVSNPKVQNVMSSLYDKLESQLRALESIGVTSDKYAAMLFPLVESCLPEETLRAWQRSVGAQEDGISNDPGNRLKKLLNFMKCEVEGEARISLARDGFGKTEGYNKLKKQRSEGQEDLPTAVGLFSGTHEGKRDSCAFCGKSHESKECFQAQKMSFGQKKAILSNKKLCFNCFKGNHQSKACRVNSKCLVCGKRHFVLMCPDLASNKDESMKAWKNCEKSETVNCGFAKQVSCGEVFLQTFMVNIIGNGKEKLVRAIVDSGSQRTYILKKLANELGLKPINSESVIHSLFGGTQSDRVEHKKFEVILKHPGGRYTCKIHALDQPVICGDITRIRKGPWFKELGNKGIWISDVGQDIPEVELLIGSDTSGKLLTGRIAQLECGLTAIETRLGWTITGAVDRSSKDESTALISTSLLIRDADIAELWKLDSIGIMDPIESKSKKEMEIAALDHFRQTVKTNEEGRYEVHLPFIEGHPEIHDNRSMAKKRLLAATKKLEDLGRINDYHAVFQDWKREGIIEPVPMEEIESFAHYLPHCGVFKDNNSTTKVRPVFDASARTKNCPSLNDCLGKGPNLIELIPAVLSRFREKKIGVVADIRKAFLQISVKKEDRNFLRFLWWSSMDGEKQLTAYRHRRVVFGVNSSPFLLAAVINHHLEKAPYEIEDSIKKLQKSFYVDNCLTSVDTEEELEKFIREATTWMSVANFDLRCWEYSSVRMNEHYSDPTPVLGLLWDKVKDELSCDMSGHSEFSGPITKRKILSVANSVFDPIGFTCPVTLIPKVILQQTWELKVGWDEPLPDEICARFGKWMEDLVCLSELKIPRNLIIHRSRKKSWSLHTFTDASKAAYGAVVYLRSVVCQDIEVQLVQAKTRVAPIKKATIPRLELLGCTIGSRLAASVSQDLGIYEIPHYYWTDSSTALSWIRNEEIWGTFVGNRVKEICSLTDRNSWRHVPGEMNPADLPSRGCMAKHLMESRWWEGPNWLKLDESFWPSSEPNVNLEEVNQERQKNIVSSLVSTSRKLWYMNYFSRYASIVKMVAWIFRFVNNSKSQYPDRRKGQLSVTEMDLAEKSLWKMIQTESSDFTRKECLKSLGVFEDSTGLIRVKTKIGRREDSADFKSPILIGSKHPLVQTLILDEHLNKCHGGVQIVLLSLREKFWVLNGRKTVRGVLGKCVRCRRFEAKKVVTIPAPLPEDRVRDASVFEISGVDLAGPLFLKGGSKSWIVLFTCANYRGVHLELISSLSTDSFWQALRRFIARRGRPAIMSSDNGTNFVGSDNLFKKVDWKKVEASASLQRIQWKFNPPTGAWWGGWWERLIRMMKDLLKRVLGNTSLDFEELMTVICDCEAVLNSRPLTYISEDMEDLQPLTPALFMQDIPEIGVPDMDQMDSSQLNRRLVYRQKLKGVLKCPFRSEYLSQLVQRAGEKGNKRPIHVGDIVLIGSDNVKRICWPMGKVIEIYPGKDKNVRVVRLKTAKGELVRPIQRIYPLEVSLEPEEVIEKKMKTFKRKSSSNENNAPDIIQTRCGRQVKVPARYSE